MTHPANKQTIVALVENKPGVLNRVASLFRRRNFNVDSLTVGRTHRAHISRMTIVVDTQKTDGRLIAANLSKLIHVIDVQIVSEQPHVRRDLALIKVRTDDVDSRNGVTEVCDRYPARIVDIGPMVAIIEITADEDIVESLIEDLRPIGIQELVRTGILAMGRGTRILDSDYEPRVPASSANAGLERYGV